MIEEINTNPKDACYLVCPPFLYRNDFRRCHCQRCWCDFGDYVDNEIQHAAEFGKADDGHLKEVSDAWDEFEKEYPQCLECIAEHFDAQTIQDMIDKKPCVLLEELIKIIDDKVRDSRLEFMKVAGANIDSLFNRIVSAFQPGVVSPVMFEADFDDACNKFVQGGYITSMRELVGGDPWHSKNVQLMNQLKTLLPNGSVEGARWPIDDYTRGIFVWAVHMMDMNNWMILRRYMEGGKQ